ncbi:MAG TPA: hypothetical protein VLU25_20470 [Acidobacteriota bacterium]|nr:hypothetical protein [Acidobacteriota bacterium]
MLGFDFLLHGGILASLYIQPSPFLRPLEEAFALIPLGYAAFLTSAITLVWLAPHLQVRAPSQGFTFGLKLGALIWGGLALGLASISTARPSLLAGWFVGQTVELAIGGFVVGSALSGSSLRSLAMKVLAFVLLAAIITIALQSLGLAPAARIISR